MPAAWARCDRRQVARPPLRHTVAVATSVLAVKGSQEPGEVVGSKPCLAEDRPEDAALHVGAPLVRDDDTDGETIGMLQLVMAAGRMVHE